MLLRLTFAITCVVSFLCELPCSADDKLTSTSINTRVDDGFQVSSRDWPWWRGPHRDGSADPSQTPPLQFSETKNLAWKAPVPGRGHGSAIVVGEHVFLQTAIKETGAQLVLCIHLDHGTVLWEKVVHGSGGMRKNEKATAASSTPACDGEHVFVAFPNDGALKLTALSLAGEIVWQKKVSNYVVHQGYGASPTLYQDLVIVTADNKAGGAIAAYARTDGELVWKRERPQKPNYCSPIILNVNQHDQLILIGCDRIVSYDPRTGKTNWETEGATTECVTSTVTDGKLIYTSGGYPRNHISAIRADGSGETAWQKDSRLYVPSLVYRDGYLYGVLDAGVAICLEAQSGRELWKKRVPGNYSSSPVLVGKRIYAVSETGDVTVWEATPTKYTELSSFSVGTFAFATPTIVGNRILHRVVVRSKDDELQDWLYCFANEE